MNQDIFDKTVTHLLRQGPTRLLTPEDAMWGMVDCGLHYLRKGEEGGCKRCALNFIGTAFQLDIDFPLSHSLFYCHDYVPQERWPGFMRGIARFFGLSELSIDMWEAEQALTSNSECHTAPSATLQENNAKILP